MALRAIFGRRWMSCLGLVAAAAAGYVFGLTSDRLAAQAPITQKPPAPTRAGSR